MTHDTRYLTPFPLYMTHGSGPLKWDVDGNEYVDYVSGHGALILGHSHPEIAAAVTRQITRGTHLGANTEEEMRWARAIKRLMPSVEKIRFHSSGTEATLMALRLARAYTSRDKVVKFREHFHGWQDYMVTTGDRPVPGVPEATSSSVIVLPSDISTVERTLANDGDVAAVILEPMGAHFGQMPLMVPGFLEELREVTRRHGVLLIMDEVVTGFRVAPGGAQGRFGIDPDLTTMAKIVAGGLPGGVVGGKADIIDMIAHRDDPEWDSRRRVSHTRHLQRQSPVGGPRAPTCLEMIASQPINERADAMAAPAEDGPQRRAGPDGGARPRPRHGLPGPPDHEGLRLRPGDVHHALRGDRPGLRPRGHRALTAGHDQRRGGRHGPWRVHRVGHPPGGGRGPHAGGLRGSPGSDEGGGGCLAAAEER